MTLAYTFFLIGSVAMEIAGVTESLENIEMLELSVGFADGQGRDQAGHPRLQPHVVLGMVSLL